MQTRLKQGLTGNQLKIIALIAMTLDHIGVVLVPLVWLRVIGRISFPIFAYMIAEGCSYTKNRKKYLLQMASLAFVCQVVYFLADRSLFQCVLVTFSLSILLIYGLDWVKRAKTAAGTGLALAAVCGVYFVCDILPGMLPGTDFRVDYGFCGVMLPVLVYLGNNRRQKLELFTLGMILLSLSLGSIQRYSLGAVVLMAFYNGTRGKIRIKNLFYIYYPLHLVVIYLIGMALNL